MSALTFEQFHAQTPGLPGHVRAQWFELLSPEERESCWAHLRAECDRAVEDYLDPILLEAA